MNRRVVTGEKARAVIESTRSIVTAYWSKVNEYNMKACKRNKNERVTFWAQHQCGKKNYSNADKNNGNILNFNTRYRLLGHWIKADDRKNIDMKEIPPYIQLAVGDRVTILDNEKDGGQEIGLVNGRCSRCLHIIYRGARF